MGPTGMSRSRIPCPSFSARSAAAIALIAVSAVAASCSSSVECKGCGTRSSPVSVSGTLNGADGNDELVARRGTPVATELTITIANGATISGLRVGVLTGRSFGLTPDGACGVQAWVYQTEQTLSAGTHHLSATFPAQAYRGVPQPMTLAVFVMSGGSASPEAAYPLGERLRVATVDPRDVSAEPPVAPSCG